MYQEGVVQTKMINLYDSFHVSMLQYGIVLTELYNSIPMLQEGVLLTELFNLSDSFHVSM